MVNKLNVLIIGSSDTQALDNSYSDSGEYTINEESDVLKTKIPCAKFVGRGKRCSRCNLIPHEHMVGYQMVVHPPHTHTYTTSEGDVYDGINNSYSDFWREKFFVFQKIKTHITNHGGNAKEFAIQYETVDPLYKNNKKYFSIIDKINDSVAKRLGFNSITRKRHYKTILNDTFKKNHYTFVFVISAGLGIMHEPKNIKIIYNILNQGGCLLHLSQLAAIRDKYDFENKYIGKLHFTPMNGMCVSQLFDTSIRKKCNEDFIKMLAKYNFTYYPDNILIKKY